MGDETSLIVRGSCQGDPESVAALIKKFTPALEIQCGSVLSESTDIDDAVHDVWLDVLPKLEGFDPVGPRHTPPFARFLAKVASNRLVDLSRGRGRTSELGDEVESWPGDWGATRSLITEELGNELCTVLRALSDKEKAVMFLHIIEGAAHAEVGQLIGISESASEKTLSRAREKLRRALGTEGPLFQELIEVTGE